MEVRRRTVLSSRSSDADLPTELIRNLDVFPKLPDDCKKPTSAGGAITLLTCLLSAILVLYEVSSYLHPHYKYSYDVDRDFDGKLQINIDLTVATRCELTSLDLLDLTGSGMESMGTLNYERATFELSNADRIEFDYKRQLANTLRVTHHNLPDLLWKRDRLFGQSFFSIISRSNKPGKRKPMGKYDACRVYGTLYARKVAGNMHMVMGKSISLAGVHMHLSPWSHNHLFNFSHRIDHLSFGPPVSNRVNPLDAIEVISDSAQQAFQYYLSIVPTRVKYTFSTSNTYQYAMTMKNRTIDHSQGSHGTPGIFITYDTFPLLVQISESRELFGTFLARLAALVGGLFATVGLLRQAYCGIPELVGNTRPGRRLQTNLERFKRKWIATLSGPSDVAPLNPASLT